ncbi:Dioscin-alpha-L-rhamnosidase precursor [Lophiotrema nucula]|uniref:alpha-amylase n=1 Tax=Lophiotrema nucula TaxID=690887 RepID=A0A6A5ZLD5_9PLEO|nr:Dioscin-alpha-L-rhamnosidase precursor [Lophiotrema nucula]
MWFAASVIVAALGRGCLAASAADWRSRSIYQVFTDRFARTDGSTSYPCNPATNIYCGGTWKGIESKLDYIKNMGFTAIWISPVTAQVDEAYHGYYQTDLYSVNSQFGSVDDLKSLASALHSRNMYLMVDVVPNHMGWPGCHDTVDYSHFKLFNKASDYHSFCSIENMQNQTELEKCWLGNCNITMPDLNTESQEVVSKMNTWIKSLVSNYSIDGLRIDSVKNVNKDFFPGWCGSAGVFCMGEVSEGEATYTYPYQKYMDSVLDYPMYYALDRVFQQKTNMSDLVVALAACRKNAQQGCKDATLLGTFLENHDKARFPSATQDMSLVLNAIAFTLMSDGIPIVYQGQEQHFAGGDDPGCREALWSSGYNQQAPLYKQIAYLNQIRNHISANHASYATYWTTVQAYDADVIQLRKDVIRTVLTNQGEKGGAYTLTTQDMGFTKGETVLNVLTCDKYTASDKGEVDVKMSGGKPSVLVPESALKGSGICSYQ